ncbi:hypothetical protein PoB_007648600 [Plakobranchus ocellatus]|uniref:Uncharacterized protein n=1 Tax=Plakobranchus ocellatus TaxID=259542 RepID=A0AAV4E1M1_9GAST|nr:hypothetical protein PoB_007648600 [Plakobranchus ocellatus]
METALTASCFARCSACFLTSHLFLAGACCVVSALFMGLESLFWPSQVVAEVSLQQSASKKMWLPREHMLYSATASMITFDLVNTLNSGKQHIVGKFIVHLVRKFQHHQSTHC